MNILFLIGVYPNYGGTEKVTTFLANQFSNEGYSIHIASFEQPKLELTEDLHEGIILHKLCYPINSYTNIKILKKIIHDFHINIIINNWCLPFFTTLLCNKARKGTQCKLISALHGVPDKSKKVIEAEDAVSMANIFLLKLYYKIKLNITESIIKNSIRYVYKNSNRYVVLSDGFLKSFQQYTNITDTSKLLSIGNPIILPTDYEKDYISQKKKQILYVGRMDMENKRVNRIIEAWEEIYKEYPDWELILVGDGPHRKLLEEYINVHNIKRVLFTGFIKEDPIKYYKKATILMLTSDLEGFGLVIVESMSYGVIPIVYGSYVSVYDIITHGKTGFITPVPYSKSTTVEYLKFIIDNPQTAKIMAHNALEKSKDFSKEVAIKKWKQLFETL